MLFAALLLSLVCASLAQDGLRLQVSAYNPAEAKAFGKVAGLHFSGDTLTVFGENKSTSLSLRSSALNASKFGVRAESSTFINYFKLVNYGVEFLLPNGLIEVRVDGKLHTRSSVAYSSLTNRDVEVVDDSLYFGAEVDGKPGHLVRQPISNLLSYNATFEVVDRNVAAFVWGDGKQQLFVAYSNLSLRWGSATADWYSTRITKWTAAVDVLDFVVAASYTFKNSSNRLILFDGNLNSLSSVVIKCGNKQLFGGQLHVSYLADPIFIRGTAYILATCYQNEATVVALKNGKLEQVGSKLSLGVSGFFNDGQILSVVLAGDKWVLGGYGWIKEVAPVSISSP